MSAPGPIRQQCPQAVHEMTHLQLLLLAILHALVRLPLKRGLGLLQKFNLIVRSRVARAVGLRSLSSLESRVLLCLLGADCSELFSESRATVG